MIINSLKLFYRYTEKALTPSIYSHLIQEKLEKSSLQEIMHQLHLYNNELTVFDYDYYQRCCYRLIDFQKQMKISDILVALKVGEKHKFKNEFLWKHFQAEIHRRLHAQFMPLLEAQKQQTDKYFEEALAELQANSQDFFNLIDKPEQLEEEEQIQAKITKIQPKIMQQQQQLRGNKTKNMTMIKYLNQITDILILYRSDRVQLLRMLLEAQSHPTLRKVTPLSVIKLAETLMYTCQVFYKEYDENKNKYTARSIKKIYKFQAWYLPDLFKLIADAKSEFSIDEMSYLIQVLSSFPIKKRQNRRKIAKIISQQLLIRNQKLEEYEQKIQKLFGTDKKLVNKFRLEYGLMKHEQIDSV